jgi:hypothetical protein
VKVALLLACLVLPAANAAAQSAFVEGGLSREIKRFSYGEGDRSPFDGTVSGVWINAGGFVIPRVSVSVEADLGGETRFEETSTVTVAGRPEEITTTYSSRRRSVGALAGIHSAPGRVVRVGVYAGLSFTWFRREIGSDAPTVVLDEPPDASVLEERVTGAVAGIDVAIHVHPNVAVVPALRAQGLSLVGDLTGFSFRPSIGARVTF